MRDCLFLVKLCFGLEFLCLFVSAKKLAKNGKVIVVVVDGLANWVLNSEIKNNSTNTLGFEILIKNGVQADYFLPEFPTASCPNQYSMVTGLYPGTHGIIADYMYDRYRRAYFSNFQRQSDLDLAWWNSTLPIWVTAAQQGVEAALYWWPGCEVKFSGTNISSLCVRAYSTFSSSADLVGEISTLIKKLQERVSMVLIHFDAVKIASQKHGPSSGKAKSKIEEVSKFLFTLQNALETYNLFRSVNLNLIVLSSHGISPVTLENSLYFLDDYLDDMETIDLIVGTGSSLFIFPRTGKEYQAYQKLETIPHTRIFWKEKLFTRWHLKGAKFLPTILLLCDSGYGVYCRNCMGKQFPEFSGMIRDSLLRGDSGYDNAAKETHGVFLARGAHFQSNYKHSWLRVVDVYQMLCDIVKIDCHQHNGSWERVSEMLNASYVLRLSNCVMTSLIFALLLLSSISYAQ